MGPNQTYTLLHSQGNHLKKDKERKVCVMCGIAGEISFGERKILRAQAEESFPIGVRDGGEEA